jgi:hypothetical protein
MPQIPHRSLVLSYSHTATDPRVIRQIGWLEQAGSKVTTVGFGDYPSSENQNHIQLKKPPLILRIASYLASRGPLRYAVLIRIPNRETFEFIKGRSNFDLIVFNDLEFAPLAKHISGDSKTHLHLDLHEYFFDQGVGFTWKILFSRYTQWLVVNAQKTAWNSISTVADSIAEMYEHTFASPKITVILSASKYENLKPKELSDEKIRLIHHGVADMHRGITELVQSMKYVHSRFELHLMLIGDTAKLKKLVSAEGLTKRVFFHQPVDTSEIARKINQFDIEIIFFPPRTKNLLHSLPNKYFEAIQGRLGIVHGPSINMMALSSKYKYSSVVPSWRYEDLVQTLNNLGDKSIEEMKRSADSASQFFCAENEYSKFIQLFSMKIAPN